MFLSARVLFLGILWHNGIVFESGETQKPRNKRHFMHTELVRKNLKIFNLTTTNAILMKLSKIMYLYEIFNLTKSWTIIPRM